MERDVAIEQPRRPIESVVLVVGLGLARYSRDALGCSAGGVWMVACGVTFLAIPCAISPRGC